MTNTDYPINLSGRSVSGGGASNFIGTAISTSTDGKVFVSLNEGVYSLPVAGMAANDSGVHVDLDDSTLAKLAARLKAMFEPPDVLVKCTHCGQWAAAMTACHFCGAPVDPVERRRVEPVTAANIAGAIDTNALVDVSGLDMLKEIWNTPNGTTARNARITYTGPDGREIDITSDVTSIAELETSAINFRAKWE